jgi:hypothetical protein
VWVGVFCVQQNISVSEKKLGYPPQLEPGILVDTVGIEIVGVGAAIEANIILLIFQPSHLLGVVNVELLVNLPNIHVERISVGENPFPQHFCVVFELETGLECPVIMCSRILRSHPS